MEKLTLFSTMLPQISDLPNVVTYRQTFWPLENSSLSALHKLQIGGLKMLVIQNPNCLAVSWHPETTRSRPSGRGLIVPTGDASVPLALLDLLAWRRPSERAHVDAVAFRPRSCQDGFLPSSTKQRTSEAAWGETTSEVPKS